MSKSKKSTTQALNKAEKIIIKELKFYDGFGDKLIIEEDGNPNIVNVTITEDGGDDGVQKQASFILGKGESLKLAQFLYEKFK